jgi:hypothetical protein
MAQKSKKTSSNKMKLSSFSAGELFIYVAAFSMIGLFTLWVSLAAPHKSGGSITGPVMVTDANSNGVANWGDVITYNVAATTTSTPNVSTRCYQNGSFVLDAYSEFYPDGVNGPNTTLKSNYWTSGAANCTARLFSYDKRGNQIVLATLNFDVNP